MSLDLDAGPFPVLNDRICEFDVSGTEAGFTLVLSRNEFHLMPIDLAHNRNVSFYQFGRSYRFSGGTRLDMAIKKFSSPKTPIEPVADFR